jgi:site-specific DNA recombinase
MNAVGYFVEGAKRDGERRGVGDQNRAFLDFCGRQGYEVSATFLDTGGASRERHSGFQQLLQYLHRAERGFTVVIVDSASALGNDMGEAAMRLLQIEATGVPILSAQTGREVIRELVDRWADRADGTPVSERVRSAMRRKAVRGEVLGRPPYGYQVGPRRRLDLVPEEAVVVRYIFRLYLQEGMGIRRIAGQLNAEGIPTRRGGNWSMVTVRDILRNRVYLGTYVRFGVKVPGSHQPLVSADDFNRVQERLQSRGTAERTRTVQPFLLSGLVYCVRCGNRLIGVSRRQRWKTKSGEEHTAQYRYYQCESRTNQSTCGYNTQRSNELEARVHELLGEDGGPSVTRVRRAGNVDSYILDLTSQVERAEARLKRNQRQLEEIVADAAHGHLSIERMRSLGAPLAEDHQGLIGELDQAKERVSAAESEAERRRRLATQRERLSGDWDELAFGDLQSALREVIDRIEVDGDDCRLFLRI